MNLFTTIFQPKKNYSSLDIKTIDLTKSIVFYLIPIAIVSVLTFVYIEFEPYYRKEYAYVSKKEWLIFIFTTFLLLSYFINRLLSILNQQVNQQKFHKTLYIVSPTIFISVLLAVITDLNEFSSEYGITFEGSLLMLLILSWIIYVLTIGVSLSYKIEYIKSCVISISSLLLGIISVLIIRELYFFIVKFF